MPAAASGGGHAGAERIPHGGDVTVDVPGGEGVPQPQRIALWERNNFSGGYKKQLNQGRLTRI